MQKKKNRNLLLQLAVIAFVVYIVVSLISLRAQIKEKNDQLDSLNRSISEQKQENLESKRLLSEQDEEKFVERYAREKLSYARYDDRFFYNVNG